MSRPLAALLCALAFLVLTGCGRLGFDAQSAAVEHVPGTSEGEDGTDGAKDGGDDIALPEEDAGARGDAGDTPTSPLDAGEELPEGDAGLFDAGDVGHSEDAGTLGAPYPLEPNLACDDYASLVACDDFDGAQRGALVISAAEGGGSTGLSNGFVTMHSTGDDQRAVVQANFASISSGALYLRFSMYLPSEVALRGLNVATFGVLATAGDFGLDLNLEEEVVELYTTGDGVVSTGSYAFPRDRWTCVLVKVESIDDTNGVVRVEIDGRQVMSVGRVDTLPPGGIEGAAAGIDWTYEGQSDTTLYVDNFLVTRAHPGGCP